MLLAASRVWAQTAAGLLFLIASIAISPAEFGEFAIATSVFAALAVCVGQGTYEYVIKARESVTAAPTVFLINLASAGAMAIATVAVSFLIPRVVHGPHIPQMLLLLTPCLFLTGVTTLMESVLMKHGAVTKVARTTLFSDTASLALALVSFVMGMGVFSLVVQRLARELMILTAYTVSHRWAPRLTFDRHQARQAIGFARSIIGIRLVGLAGTAAVDVVIGATLGARDAGIYRLAARILTTGSDVLYQPFRAALWVRLPPLQNDGPAFRRTVVDLMEIFGVGMFAVMSGIALISGPLFEMFLKPEWQAGIPIVILMAVGRLVFVPSMSSEVVFALRNQMRFLSVFTTVSAILGAAVSFAAINFGLKSFVIVGIIFVFIQQLILMPKIIKCIDWRVDASLAQLARLSTNAIIMVAAVAPMLALEAYFGAPAWVQGASGIGVGATVYILAARHFTPVGYAAYQAGLVAGIGALRRAAHDLKRRGASVG